MSEANDLKNAGVFKEWWANPSIIGLMGFALTTMVTGLHNAGYFDATPTLALAIAFGGTAQFVAGIVDLRKGSIFGGSAFISYGAFWWSVFVFAFVLPKLGFTTGAVEHAVFFGVWALFTFSFCIAVLKVGKYLSVLFWLLLLAFILLTLLSLGLAPKVLVGWEIFITGLFAWYIATAELVNTVHGKKVLPLA